MSYQSQYTGAQIDEAVGRVAALSDAVEEIRAEPITNEEIDNIVNQTTNT